VNQKGRPAVPENNGMRKKNICASRRVKENERGVVPFGTLKLNKLREYNQEDSVQPGGCRLVGVMLMVNGAIKKGD